MCWWITQLLGDGIYIGDPLYILIVSLYSSEYDHDNMTTSK